MSIVTATELTPREHILMEAEKEERRLAREHAIAMKQLEIEALKQEKALEIELRKLETKWGQWLRIPLVILKLPVLVIVAFAYLIAVARKYKPEQAFWKLLR